MKLKRDIHTKDFYAIFESDQPPIEKLAGGFEYITAMYLSELEKEIEVLRALQDQQELVKAQIRLSTTQTMNEVFQDCYMLAQGKRTRS